MSGGSDLLGNIFGQAKLSPFESNFRNTFQDNDQVAAAWRLYAASVEGTDDFKFVAGWVEDLVNAYNSYHTNLLKKKTDRFNLRGSINDPTEAERKPLNTYFELLNNEKNRNLTSNLTTLFYHLESLYGVSATLIANVTLGSLDNRFSLKPKVLGDVAQRIGATHPIKDVPGPTLAGDKIPARFSAKTKGGGNNFRRSSRRRRRY